MPMKQEFAQRLGLILGAICAVLLSVALGHASDYGAFAEEFHKTYPLTANGRVALENIKGDVRASCINGRLTAKGLQGRTKLSTVNSRIEAEFDKLSGSAIDLNSVNGGVVLTLPSDASADLEASTVSGRISNEFGLGVNNHRYVGHDLRGQLASGGTRIRLSN